MPALAQETGCRKQGTHQQISNNEGGHQGQQIAETKKDKECNKCQQQELVPERVLLGKRQGRVREFHGGNLLCNTDVM